MGKNKQKLIIIFVVLLISLILFLIFRSNPDIETDLLGECENIKEKISKEIDKMSYCETKNDCVLLNGCAYGCNNLINKNAEMQKFVELESKFIGECGGTCETNCAGSLKPNEIVCRDKKCVSTRI